MSGCFFSCFYDYPPNGGMYGIYLYIYMYNMYIQCVYAHVFLYIQYVLTDSCATISE